MVERAVPKIYLTALQASLAIVNLDIVKTRLYYSEINRYNESEENAAPNKLKHSGTSGALHLTTK